MLCEHLKLWHTLRGRPSDEAKRLTPTTAVESEYFWIHWNSSRRRVIVLGSCIASSTAFNLTIIIEGSWGGTLNSFVSVSTDETWDDLQRFDHPAGSPGAARPRQLQRGTDHRPVVVNCLTRRELRLPWATSKKATTIMGRCFVTCVQIFCCAGGFNA